MLAIKIFCHAEALIIETNIALYINIYIFFIANLIDCISRLFTLDYQLVVNCPNIVF